MKVLPISMREALQELLNNKSSTRKASPLCDAEQERLAAIEPSKAMSRIKPDTPPDVHIPSTDGYSSEATPEHIKRPHKRFNREALKTPFENDMACFTSAFEQSDFASLRFEDAWIQCDWIGV